MHKQAIKHKQAIIGGGYLFTENACSNYAPRVKIDPARGHNFTFNYISKN